MYLEVFDPDNTLDRDFGFWLCRKIKKHFIDSIDVNKLVSWQEFFNNSEKFKNMYGVPVNCYNVLLDGINTLYPTRLPDKIIISLNKNQYMSGFDRIKIDTLFRLITFGNTQISGYRLFLDTLNYFVENINDLVELYEEGL